ncbi:hypothetical protein PPTG_19816, partial [Phytophthora nicotianae INRA-310]
GCQEQCYPDECINSKLSIFCSTKNCSLGGVCGNSFEREADGLTLFRSRVGIVVYTRKPIDPGVIIAEYCGQLRAYDGMYKSNVDPAKLKHNTGYSMLLHTRPTRTGYFAFVEAVKYGGIARFINHSDSPNTAFRELRNRRSVKVGVVSTRTINPGDELTVDYGDEIWFACAPTE